MPVFLVMLTSACSLRDRDVNYGISVQLPASSQNALGRVQPLDAFMNVQGIPAPTSISGLQCFALNITGPGINADQRFGCKRPDQKMGLMAGMAPVAGGKIDAMVPAGAARLIQLIGLQSTVGCPSFEQILAAKNQETGEGGFEGIGDPYLLGSASVDVFGDTTVNITANFDPNLKLFQDCDDGGDHHEIAWSQVNESTAIQAGQCLPISIQASQNQSNALVIPADVTPVIQNIVGVGVVELFTSAGCSPGHKINTGSPVELTSNFGQANLWIKASTTVTSFELTSLVADANWIARLAKFTTVAQRLTLTSPTPAPIAQSGASACGDMTLGMIDAAGNPVAFNETLQYEMIVHNDSSSGNAPSTVKFYMDYNDCYNDAPAMLGVLMPGGGNRLKYTLPTSMGFHLFVRAPTAQRASVGITLADNSIQGVAVGFEILPFTLSPAQNSSLLQVPLAGGPIQLLFTGGAASITAASIDGLPCTGLTISGATVTCNAPPHSNSGDFLITLIANTGSGVGTYVSGVSMTYLPFFSGIGAAADPYIIKSGIQFIETMNNPTFNSSGKYFRQEGQIDLNPISRMSAYFYLPNFLGHYDGNFQDIVGMHSGLFENCTNAQIQNLRLVNPIVNVGTTRVGALCGTASIGYFDSVRIDAGTITNTDIGATVGAMFGRIDSAAAVSGCSVGVGSMVTGANASTVGGLIGEVVNATVSDSWSFAGITADANGIGGGLIGTISGATTLVEKSFSRGSLFVNPSSFIGGFVGKMFSGTVRKSFAEPYFNGVAMKIVGGFVGEIASTGTIIQDSYARSNTLQAAGAGSFAGGFVGYAPSSGGTFSVTRCYSRADVINGTSIEGPFAGNGYSGDFVNALYLDNSQATSNGSATPIAAASFDNPAAYSTESFDLVTIWGPATSTPSGDINNSPVHRWSCAGTPVAVAAGKSCF